MGLKANLPLHDIGEPRLHSGARSRIFVLMTRT